MKRVVATLALLLVAGSEAIAQQNDATAKVGDRVVILMSGELASEYARRAGMLKSNDAPVGLQVEVLGVIAQQLDDGRVRFEHSSHTIQSGKTTRLLTLTGTIDPRAISQNITPKGTSVASSPVAQCTQITEDIKTLHVRLSDLKGLKLRTWTLSDELGE